MRCSRWLIDHLLGWRAGTKLACLIMLVSRLADISAATQTKLNSAILCLAEALHHVSGTKQLKHCSLPQHVTSRQAWLDTLQSSALPADGCCIPGLADTPACAGDSCSCAVHAGTCRECQ